MVSVSADLNRVTLDNRGSAFVPDQLRGRVLVVTGEEPRRILSNDEDSALVSRAYASDPGTVAYTIEEPDAAEGPHPSTNAHPGGQAGHNAVLSDLIATAEETIVAVVLPT